jgi:hypothetical protein
VAQWKVEDLRVTEIYPRGGRQGYDELTGGIVRPCSNCGHRKFRRVRRVGLVDGLMVMLGLYPWECENCQHRTYSRRRDPHHVKGHSVA